MLKISKFYSNPYRTYLYKIEGHALDNYWKDFTEKALFFPSKNENL